MKNANVILFVALMVFTASSATAQLRNRLVGTGGQGPRADGSSGSVLINFKATPPPPSYAPRDRLRDIGGKVIVLHGIDPDHGWVEFVGTVTDVQPGGVFVYGCFTGSEPAIEFCLTNFPYTIAKDDRLCRDQTQMTFLCAKLDGTIAHYGNMVHRLDYGRIHSNSPEEIAAARAKADAARKLGANHALELNEAAAATNNPYGLLRMGERYRDGDGVEKNSARAKDYLQRAADAGSPTAADELKRLDDSK